MKLTFLGTAAANAFPEPFCSCENCVQARALGGPSLRKRSAALIDGELLIDLGPDILTASNQHRIPLTRVHLCLQTHAHADHLDLSHLQSRSPAFGTVGTPVLHFYASSATLQQADALYRGFLTDEPLLSPETEEALRVKFHAIEPYRPFDAAGYHIIPFPTRHAPGALLYAIRKGGRAVFYGTDASPWDEDMWDAFHRFALQFDLVVLDHTYGPEQKEHEDHLNARQVSAYARRMRDEGLLAPEGRIFATHIAHEGNPPHPQLSAYAARHGYQVAYDGLTIQLA